MTIARGDAGQAQPARLGRGQSVGDRRRQPQVGAVGDARRLDRDDARGAQQVLGLVAQDELLELAREQQDADRRRLVAGRPARRCRRANRAAARRHPKPPAGSVMSRADASVSPRDDELSATAAADRRRLPARRRGLQGGRARAAADLHAPPHARRLRHGRAAADRRSSSSRSSLRLGLGEALVRFHFLDDGPRAPPRARAHRDRARCSSRRPSPRSPSRAFAEPISAARCSAPTTPTLIRAAALGLWAFTNLELAYALLRVEERARAFAIASLTNVALTVVLTVSLVVVARRGRARPAARQLRRLAPSSCSACGAAPARRVRRAGRIDARTLGPMLRFGLPTVPAEVSVFALFFIDRFWLYRFESPRPRARACTRSRSSSPASSSSPCARSSTPGRRSPTRSRTTREAAPRLRPHHDLLRALHRARRRRPGAARPLARARSSPRPSSSPRTRRCRGSRSAGRSTACSSCSWRWPAARRSRSATRPPRSRAWSSTSRCSRCSSRRWGSPAPASRSRRLRRDARRDVR